MLASQTIWVSRDTILNYSRLVVGMILSGRGGDDILATRVQNLGTIMKRQQPGPKGTPPS
jgi:hypothetical protein